MSSGLVSIASTLSQHVRGADFKFASRPLGAKVDHQLSADCLALDLPDIPRRSGGALASPWIAGSPAVLGMSVGTVGDMAYLRERGEVGL